MTKSDFLKECMGDMPTPIPLDQFSKAFCLVCANRECARSAGNTMAFDKRVLNWKEDLFINVRRAEPNDPAFLSISKKIFLNTNPSLHVPGTPEFVNSEPISNPVRFTPRETEVVVPSIPDLPTPELEPASVKIESEPTQDIPKTYSQPHAENTPFQQGVVLPGGEKSIQKEEVILTPGSTFTFPDE